MRRLVLVPVLAVLGTFGAAVASAQGQGQGQGQGKGPPVMDGGQIVATPDHGIASPPFGAADPVDSVELGEGSWKITASGAISFDDTPIAPNCGLRVADGDGNFIMLAKQNIASEDDKIDTDRDGFSIVGAVLDVEDAVVVDLVCFGGDVFEHNIVAIGGASFEGTLQ